MCWRNKLTPAQKAVKKWNDYKTSLALLFLSFLVIFGLSAAGIALNDPILNGILAGHLTIVSGDFLSVNIKSFRIDGLIHLTSNSMCSSNTSPLGLIALWSNDHSTPAKKLKTRGFDPAPADGISESAQNGPVVGCLTMDLMVGLGSFQVMYNLYASLRHSRKANEDPTPNRAV
ncbi:hypothetical protein B0J14DRAFT_634435 [Halenospora varia]|nr:hypothetical protein B0J14DRAFT_634435 [Halenospora varia]